MNPSPKATWKNTVKEAVIKAAKEQIETEANKMSTLYYLSKNFNYKAVHPALDQVHNHRQVIRVNVKIRLLIGVYPLQTQRKRIKQVASDCCPLCKEEREDLHHFLFTCNGLMEARGPLQSTLLAHIPTREARVRSILEPSENPHPVVDIEEESRTAIFRLHNLRSALIRNTLKGLK